MLREGGIGREKNLNLHARVLLEEEKFCCKELVCIGSHLRENAQGRKSFASVVPAGAQSVGTLQFSLRSSAKNERHQMWLQIYAAILPR